MVSTDEVIQLRAPAKINLSFRILGRRTDGYHEIDTLMAPVSVYDEITITRLPGPGEIELICDDPTLPSDGENLAFHAARIFLQHERIASNVRIELSKKIPHGAGLGGGSSDAATVFLGMDELFQAGLSERQMAELASHIGSDIPFFIYQSAAQCCGRGEIVRPNELSKRLHLLLLKPSFGISTSWAYKHWKESQELPGIRYEAQEFAGFSFVNDLERPAFEKYVFLARMKMWLLEQAEVGAAMLSGSGSTLFAVLRDGADGDSLGQRAKAELDSDLWTYECETL
ncbi:MAG: 4-(cytidine 5'-diphospho)-2-C-methyl-D-erythritol kinase [Verrucomicrobiota bacterium]|nr:4-(cytidine 5'-diphospho)-2-C-methyl-D-erythritol kinase [Verrucomicrobiota bacterium]